MNTEQTTANMQQLKGKIKETWGKLTSDDIMLYDGKRDQFIGKLKEHYGMAKKDAEKKIKTLEDTYGHVNKAAHNTAM